MKIIVTVDNHGCFHAAHEGDRKSILNILKKIDDGIYFKDILSENKINIKSNLSEYCCQEWDKLLQQFIQKGVLDLIEISDNIPTTCKCS